MTAHKDEMAAEKPAGLSRRIRVLLVSSLALNLLFVGLFVGAGARHGATGGPPRLDQLSAPMVQALDRKDRRMIGRDIREAYRNGAGEGAENLDSNLIVINALRAAPFDPDPIMAALIAQKSAGDMRKTIARGIMLKRISAMSESERADYATSLEKEFKRAGSRRDKWRKRRDDK